MENRIKEWLKQLTLEEKVSLTLGRDFWSTNEVERLGIPSINLNDGPHGIRKPMPGKEHDLADSYPSTCFPTASGIASSWNTELIHQVAQAIANECLALDTQILLGPGVNMKRSPLGGRNFEYFSEDPVLSGEMGAAFVQGVQSLGVGTSLKHFACNEQEFERMSISAEVDTRALRELYLSAFERVVKKAAPWTIMSAYNKVNGVYASENPELLRNILKGEWGYEGFVMSDWGAVNDKGASIAAGLDLEMPGNPANKQEKIVKMIHDGALSESALDEAVSRVLRIVLQAEANRKPDSVFDADAHHALARKVAGECLVLLKNEEAILPLKIDSIRSIAVIGKFAKNPRYQGAGSSLINPTKLENAYDELVRMIDGKVEISYADGYPDVNESDEAMLQTAVDLAKASDVAIIFAGLPKQFESEGFDRSHIQLPLSHNRLIEAVCQVQPHTIVVLSNGSAVAMPWIEGPKAIVEGWLGGQASGGAAADVLLGVVNPSGKLSETFPVRIEDSPSFMNFPGEEDKVRYGEGLFIGYRYNDKMKVKPLFPFGYGLSYTTFAYSDLRVDKQILSDLDSLEVSLKVRNTGTYAGKEVVQIYVRDIESKLIRPAKELKAFTKVSLAAGEEKEIRFILEPRDFTYYDSQLEMWICESGQFEILACASSVEIKLSTMVTMDSKQLKKIRLSQDTLLKTFWVEPALQILIKQLISKSSFASDPNFYSPDSLMFIFFMEAPIKKLTNLGAITQDQLDAFIEEVQQSV